MKRSYFIAAGLAVAATAWILSGLVGDDDAGEDAAPAPVAEAEPLPQVRVRTVAAQARTSELVLFGRSEAERTVSLRAETKGRVVERAVAKGDRVEAGDALVRLAVDDRKAQLREAEARVEQYRIAYKAAAKLAEKKFRSEVKLVEEKAELEAAKARLAAIRLDIERTVIRAPFAGVVDDLPAEIGDFIDIGDPVAVVADLEPILVVGEVSERDVAGIPVGAPATVRLAGGPALDGRVRYVSRVGTSVTRTFRVEVEVDNPGWTLAEGLTAELRLATGQTFAHRVSPAILTLSEEGVIGVKAVEDGTVVFFPADVVADTTEGVWLAGLPDTVTLITVGQEFVRAGQRVRTVPDDEVAS